MPHSTQTSNLKMMQQKTSTQEPNKPPRRNTPSSRIQEINQNITDFLMKRYSKSNNELSFSHQLAELYVNKLSEKIKITWDTSHNSQRNLGLGFVPKNIAKHLSNLIIHLAMLARIKELNDQRQLANSASAISKRKISDYFTSMIFSSSKAKLNSEQKKWLDLAQSDAKNLNDIIEKMRNKTETNQNQISKIHESIEEILKNKLKKIMKKYPPLNNQINFCCVIIGQLLIDHYTLNQCERFLESLAAAIHEEHIYEEINYEEINDVKKTEDIGVRSEAGSDPLYENVNGNRADPSNTEDIGVRSEAGSDPLYENVNGNRADPSNTEDIDGSSFDISFDSSFDSDSAQTRQYANTNSFAQMSTESSARTGTNPFLPGYEDSSSRFFDTHTLTMTTERHSKTSPILLHGSVGI